MINWSHHPIPKGITMHRPRIVLLLCTLLFAGLLGCSDDEPTAPTTGQNNGEIVTDFSLSDVNATSVTVSQAISPRDYLEKVSAWYFGHST
ncbi:MAG: hypothetical protein QNL91_06050 [Candidatus Krumholzibacteria bacterium]|nr:hypothetical protein [Candidatus Krumholzibacteria bacterium]